MQAVREKEESEFPEDVEINIGQNPVDTEENSIIIIKRGDNLTIWDLSKNHTEGKKAHYIQVKHIVNQLTTSKKFTEDCTKKPEFNFVLDLKTQNVI